MEKVILEREALKLPAHERALLADALLGSLDDEAVRNAEAACAQESEDRYQAFLRGEIEVVDGPTVFRQLRARHAK
ncbi:MAG: addiction module protein [Verrucomicrobiota bacterium]|nr:addiction module protein [Verrucomicrobiota bacterium]